MGAYYGCEGRNKEEDISFGPSNHPIINY